MRQFARSSTPRRRIWAISPSSTRRGSSASLVFMARRPPGLGWSSSKTHSWPSWRQVVGAASPSGQPDDGHSRPLALAPAGRVGRRQVRVGDVAFQFAHGHRIIGRVAATTFFAWFGADPSQHRRIGCRVWIVAYGLLAALRPDLPEHERNVHVRRAGEEARGQAIAPMHRSTAAPTPFVALHGLLAVALDFHAVHDLGRGQAGRSCFVGGFAPDTPAGSRSL